MHSKTYLRKAPDLRCTDGDTIAVFLNGFAYS